MPHLQPIYEKYHDQGLEIVAIERTRDTERAKAFIRKKGLSFTFLEDGEGDQEVNARIFGVHAYPTSFIINPDGKILFYHLGFDEGDETKIEREIRQVLGS